MFDLKRVLILVTDCFPYGNGETFLEVEIKYLSDKFDEIFIASSFSDSSPQRQLPANCSCFNYDLRLDGKKISIFMKVLFLLQLRFWLELFRSLRCESTISILAKIKHILAAMHEGSCWYDYLKSIVGEQLVGSPKRVFLYSYWSSNKAYAVARIKKSYKNKIICFSRAHGWDLYFDRSPLLYLPFRKFLIDNLDAIFFISNDGKEYFAKTVGGDNPSKMIVSCLGVPESPESRPCTPTDCFQIVTCSNIVPVKRLDILIEALSRIMDFKIRWLHFGDGQDAQKIKDLADQKLGARNNISYSFMGSVPNQELLEFYSKNFIDLFVNISSHEGIPVSIMEAMSFGIPVIATKVGGVHEIVDNENGLLLQPNPIPEEIATEIRKFRSLPGTEYALYQKSAYKTWKEQYNAKINYSAFVLEILDLSKPTVD